MPRPVVSREFDRGMILGLCIGAALWAVGIVALLYVLSLLI